MEESVRQYCINVLYDTDPYYRLFGAREGWERLAIAIQNIYSMLCADTGSSIYLLATEAVERAVNLKKVLDEYNESLLVPIPFSWITVHRVGDDVLKFRCYLHNKPRGNCGIVICPGVDAQREFAGFNSFALQEGLFCLEQRCFSLEELEERRTLISEPLILYLEFTSKEKQEAFQVFEHIPFVLRHENKLQLYVERLDCTLVVQAFTQGARSYYIWRERESVIYPDSIPSHKEMKPNYIPKCCLPYCNSHEQLLALNILDVLPSPP